MSGIDFTFRSALLPERGDTRDSPERRHLIQPKDIHAPMKALIIAEPWISHILDGSKTWEMRSRPTKIRGQFGLIRKGSGAIYGVATLVDCDDPLTPNAMMRAFDKHRIPKHLIGNGQVAKWNCPWMLSSVQKLSHPVPYRHKPGAVTWINLDPEVTVAIRSQLANLTIVDARIINQ